MSGDFNVVIRDGEDKPLTVWFETEAQMVAFIHLWDAIQRDSRELRELRREVRSMVAELIGDREKDAAHVRGEL